MASAVSINCRSLLRVSFRSNISYAISNKFSSETEQTQAADPDEVIVSGRKYVNRKIDENVLKELTHVSRLETQFRNRMLHVLQPNEDETHPDFYKALFQKPELKKVIFTSLGKKSGMNPNFLWPSEEELKETKEFEEEWEPSLQQLWEEMKQKQEEEFNVFKEREKLIDEKMAKMPHNIEEYRKKLKKMNEQTDAVKQKKTRILEEARDFFGYHIALNDPRFEQLKLVKEEEEKTLKRKMKKEEKQLSKHQELEEYTLQKEALKIEALKTEALKKEAAKKESGKKSKDKKKEDDGDDDLE